MKIQALGLLLALGGAACGSKTVTANKVETVILETTFNADPTQQDTNGDGIKDWVIRDKSAFDPNWQKSGYVSLPSFEPILDSRPQQVFSDNLEMTCEMRALTHTSTDPNFPRGASCWVNVDYTATDYTAVSMNVVLNADGTQSLALVNYLTTTSVMPAVIKRVDGLPNDFIKATVHVYNSTSQLGLVINGTDYGKFAMVKWPFADPTKPNTDHFASLLGWEETAGHKSFKLAYVTP